MKTTGPSQKPPPHPFYGEYSHRGLDPWHRDAAPKEFGTLFPHQDPERKSGWYLEDAWGNEIGFVLDGTPFNEVSEFNALIVKPE